MNYLRSGTEVQHRELEREVDLLRAAFTRVDYVSLIDGFHGFLPPWERRIADFFEARKKLRHIESDVRYL